MELAPARDVRLREVDSARAAPTSSSRTDDRALRNACGRDCLGYTSAIGRPRDGRSPACCSAPRWVAKPVRWRSGSPRTSSATCSGCEHRGGRACSLMSPRAFDTRCSPSVSIRSATAEQLACVPAPADVDAAARLYGGRVSRADPRCL